MSEEFSIREITAADVPAIVRQRRMMFEDMGFTDGARNDRMDESVTGYLARAIPAGEYRGWLAEDSTGEVVAGIGMAVVRLPGKPMNPSGLYVYLMSLYVEPAYRRRGIARRLLDRGILWAGSQGITEAKLHASPQGRLIYDRMGFLETNEMRLLLDS